MKALFFAMLILAAAASWPAQADPSKDTPGADGCVEDCRFVGGARPPIPNYVQVQGDAALHEKLMKDSDYVSLPMEKQAEMRRYYQSAQRKAREAQEQQYKEQLAIEREKQTVFVDDLRYQASAGHISQTYLDELWRDGSFWSFDEYNSVKTQVAAYQQAHPAVAQTVPPPPTWISKEKIMTLFAILIASLLDPVRGIPALILGLRSRTWWHIAAGSVAISIAVELVLFAIQVARVFNPTAFIISIIATATWSGLAFLIKAYRAKNSKS